MQAQAAVLGTGEGIPRLQEKVSHFVEILHQRVLESSIGQKICNNRLQTQLAKLRSKCIAMHIRNACSQADPEGSEGQLNLIPLAYLV